MLHCYIMTQGKWNILNIRNVLIKCYIACRKKEDSEIEIMFILLIFIIEVDYCLRDCAYVFVLDYLDYRNAP